MSLAVCQAGLIKDFVAPACQTFFKVVYERDLMAINDKHKQYLRLGQYQLWTLANV